MTHLNKNYFIHSFKDLQSTLKFEEFNVVVAIPKEQAARIKKELSDYPQDVRTLDRFMAQRLQIILDKLFTTINMKEEAQK